MARMSNGYGSCHKIDSKNKRKCPYRVRVTDRWEFDEKTGKAVQKYRTLGYYPTRKEGLAALAEYNKNPARRGTADITFAMLFEMWKEKRDFDNLSKANQKGYRGSFKHSAKLHNMKVAQITSDHLNEVMREINVGVSKQKLLKAFWNQLFDLALEKDIVTKNYSKFVKTRDKDTAISNRNPFTKEQIQLLWDNVDMEGVAEVLILVYTGMRPSELLEIHKDNVYLEERYMIGGKKTAAGRDRVIPIHKRIIPLMEQKLQSGSDYLISMPDGRPMQYRYFLCYVWNPVKDKLGFDKTPHEARYTFISLMTEAGADQRLLKEIVGHSTGDITQRYTKISIERKIQEIDLLT